MIRIFLAGALMITLYAGAQSAESPGGKPAMKPLPDWCNMGECITPTIEHFEPILFHQAGVLFRVEGETWSFPMQNPKKKTRLRGTGPSYVFCSKTIPAVLSPSDGQLYVDLLVLDDESQYGHANAVSLSQYFAVCHGRVFDGFLTGAPKYARDLGYKVEDREEQRTIARPEEVLKLLPQSGQ